MSTTNLSLVKEDGAQVSMEVRLAPVSVRLFYAVNERVGNLDGIEAFQELAEQFAPFVESWSREEPVSVDALLDLDLNDLVGFVRSWLTGVAKAPIPLARRSSDGGQSGAQAETPSP